MEARKIHPLLSLYPEIADRIRDLEPYDPVSSLDRIQARPEMVHYKLDWNESTVPPSPKVLAAVLKYLQNGCRLNWYPEMHNARLFERIAAYVGCEPSQVLVTNGSDDALDLICQCYLDADDNVVAPVPTYTHFLHFAKRTGAAIREVKSDNLLLPSLKDVSRAVDENTKIIYLVNPNNPTGNLYSPAEVMQLALRHPQCLIVSDEAYFEFAGISCAKLLDDVDNIIVTRSFSKCFGLAAMRIGYLVADQNIINDLRRVHNPKSVNMLAQIAATAALEDLPYYKNYVRSVKRSASLVAAFCRQRGIECWSTYANFILIRFDNAPAVVSRLAEKGVYVRDRSRLISGMVRFSLGTEDQTREVLQRLGQVLDELHPA